jgi:serine/threonine protein kinase
MTSVNSRGRQYLVTEYVDGGTLKDWVKDKRRTPKEVAELLTGVARSVYGSARRGDFPGFLSRWVENRFRMER